MRVGVKKLHTAISVEKSAPTITRIMGRDSRQL